MSYKETIYTKLNILDLILLAIYLVKKNKEICTFERLVAECFNNFPKVFSFQRYPQWPDSLKFDRSLRKLREKSLIIGGVGGNYSPGQIILTFAGENKAKQVKLLLSNKKTTIFLKRKIIAPRSIDEKLVYQLEINPYFKKFINNPKSFTITESDYRNILRCTLETPIRIIKQNHNYYKKLAETYNKNKMLDFLSYCENKFLKTN